MYLLLALDVSSKTGFSVFQVEETEDKIPIDISLVRYGLIKMPKPVKECGDYPWNYLRASKEMGKILAELVSEVKPRVVVVEETNKGRARYSQKLLEFLHAALLDCISSDTQAPAVFYLSTSEWRNKLGIRLSKDDKKSNQKLSKAKKNSIDGKIDRKALGIRGRLTAKHLSVRYANERFGLQLKIKDNDVSDAICLGEAFALGARPCSGGEDFGINPFAAMIQRN
jgi:hypothetical protein